MLPLGSSLSDTIVACATAPGDGAIAIVRLSGARSREILAELTASDLPPAASHRLRVATIVDGAGAIVDRGMVVEMIQPNSYTGEDVVELHLHGSRVIVQRVLERAQDLGARGAEAGEFTLRAFLNGRMSLAEAEGVGDLIAARNKEQAAVAARQGELSRSIMGLVDGLERVLVDWRAVLDFPEYPTGDGYREPHLATVERVAAEVRSLVAGSRVGLYRQRAVVLAGAPNVGKSTLLNALVGRERVLVDASPGTTRDPVEVELVDGLTRWTVVDTAGLRAAATGLEAAGIRLTREVLARGDLVVWLLDPSAPAWPPPDVAVDVILGSKADLADGELRRRLEDEATARGASIVAWVCAREAGGAEVLRAHLRNIVAPVLEDEAVVVVRRRHLEALERAGAALERLVDGVASRATLDVLAIELEEATAALASILGRDVDEEVLEGIFSEFCVGK